MTIRRAILPDAAERMRELALLIAGREPDVRRRRELGIELRALLVARWGR